MKKMLIFMIVVLGASGLAAWLSTVGGQARVAAPFADEGQAAPASGNVGSATAVVAMPAAPIPSAPASPAPERAFRYVAPGMSPEPSGGPSSRHEEALQAARLAMAKWESAWNMDGADPGNDARIERAISDAITSEFVAQVREKPMEVTATCRVSMCRIEGRFPASADGTEWSTRVLLAMGATFGASATVRLPLNNREDRVITYATRLGRERVN